MNERPIGWDGLLVVIVPAGILIGVLLVAGMTAALEALGLL